jgi:hypothetical protein
MRASKTLLCVTIVVGLFAASASGGTIKTFIDSLGAHDEWFNDLSWERVIDSEPPGDPDHGVVSPGDILEGVFSFDSIGENATSNRMFVGPTSDDVELTGYFRLEVTGIQSFGGLFYKVDLGPNSTFESEYGTGAMAVAFEDDGRNFDPSLPTANQIIATAKDGTHLMTLGFTGSPGEGWAAVAVTNSILGAQAFGNNSFGSYQANLNRLLGEGGELAALVIPKSQVSPWFSPPAGPLYSTEFSLNGQLMGSQPGSTFPLSDDTNVFFTVVPEPSTLLGLLMGAFALMGYAWAGRKR